MTSTVEERRSETAAAAVASAADDGRCASDAGVAVYVNVASTDVDRRQWTDDNGTDLVPPDNEEPVESY